MSNIKCGSYTGNGSTTGPTVTLGWEPQWVMIKRANTTGNWIIYDSQRDSINPINTVLFPNNSGGEFSGSTYDLDFLSTGFQPKNTADNNNGSGDTYIYIAIRKEGV